MNKQSWILGALLAIAPALSPAQVQAFRSVDRNGDGFISSEEWYGQPVAPVPFTVIDLNGDGKISESEFREWSSARGGSSTRGVTSADRFRAIDRNKDGVIQPEEWKEGSFGGTPFSSVDSNKDGRISPREFSAWDLWRPAAAAPELPGTAAPSMDERLRSLDRGAAGVPPVQAPPRASTSSGAPLAPASATPSISPIPGAGSPNMRSGSANSTK